MYFMVLSLFLSLFMSASLILIFQSILLKNWFKFYARSVSNSDNAIYCGSIFNINFTSVPHVNSIKK